MAHSGSHPKGHRPAFAHLFPTLPRRLQLEPEGRGWWGGGPWGCPGAPGWAQEGAQDWPALHRASPESPDAQVTKDQNPRPVPNGATFSYLFGGRGAGRQRGGGPGRQAISPHGASFLGPCSAGTWVPSALWSPPARRHRGERALTCPAPPRPQARPLGEAPSSQPPSACSLPPLPLDSAARLRGDLLQTEPSARPPARPGPTEELRGPLSRPQGVKDPVLTAQAPPEPGCSPQWLLLEGNRFTCSGEDSGNSRGSPRSPHPVPLPAFVRSRSGDAEFPRTGNPRPKEKVKQPLPSPRPPPLLGTARFPGAAG